MITIADILPLLPGLDCGLCRSQRGCRGYAERVVSGETDLGLCLPGGGTLRAKLTELVAERGDGRAPVAAVLACQGSARVQQDRFGYRGVATCRAAIEVSGGPGLCRYGCLRFGDCAAACPFGAITMGTDGLPRIDFAACTGCGRCVAACPKDIIALVPKSQQVFLACLCQARAEGLDGTCSRGCTSCGTCVEACPYGAISWDRALPRIDHSRCRSCSICVYKCPSKTFLDRIPVRPTAFIGLQCTGCEQCKSVCPTDCIMGRKNEHHKVVRGQCIGCGQCFEVCPFKAITMLGALGHVDLSSY